MCSFPPYATHCWAPAALGANIGKRYPDHVHRVQEHLTVTDPPAAGCDLIDSQRPGQIGSFIDATWLPSNDPRIAGHPTMLESFCGVLEIPFEWLDRNTTE